MKNIFSMAVAVLCLGTTALVASGSHATQRLNDPSVQFATDGAFRDGLYLGKFDANAQRPASAAIARWSGERDRTSFIAGYHRGYNDVVANSTPGTIQAE